LEKRGLGWDGAEQDLNRYVGGAHGYGGDGEANGAGNIKRDLLKQWIGGNM
jgi:hypothetical protein